MSIPVPDNENERLSVLRAHQILDTPNDEAFDRMTRLASSILKMPIALVSLVDQDRQWFKSRVGLDAEETPREQAFCAHTIMNDEVMVVPDALADPRFSENPLVTADPNIRFYAGAPLTTCDGYNLGTLCVIDRSPRELDDEQKYFLRNLASMVVSQMELRLRKSTDPLTGAFTDRYFMEAGDKELHNAGILGQPFSVGIIDVDGFASINDDYGAEAGDAVLMALARLVESHTRPQDIIARLGDHEFAVLMPEIAEADAREVFARIREGAAHLDLEVNGRRLTIAVTIGVTASRADDSEFQDAVSRARKALHAVENAGQNRQSSRTSDHASNPSKQAHIGKNPQATRTGLRTLYKIGLMAPLLVLLFGGPILSWLAFNQFKDADAARLRADFDRTAYHQTDVISAEIGSSIAILRSVRALFDASTQVTRGEFRAFVASLETRDMVHAVEWVPRVRHAERKAYEQTARKNGLPEFKILERQSDGAMVPARERMEYFPVYFVEPLTGNEAAVGFDLASNPAWLQALQRTRDTGEIVASGRIKLGQETGDQYGFLAFTAMYRKGVVPDTVAERRENLMGFGLAVFRMSELIASAMPKRAAENWGLEISIIDETAPVESRLLYPNDEAQVFQSTLGNSVRFERLIEVAGRSWRLVVSPANPAAFAPTPWQAWAILLAGLIVTGLGVLYLTTILRRSSFAENLVERRTLALKQANRSVAAASAEKTDLVVQLQAVLANIDTGIIFMGPDLRAWVINKAFRDMWGVSEEFVARNPSFFEMIEYLRQTGVYDVPDEQWDEYIETRYRSVVRADGISVESDRSDGCVFEYKCIPLPNGGRMITYTDITERKKFEDSMKRQALHDPLTGLPNRLQLRNRLEDAISQADRSERIVGLMLLDLDNFKNINDSLGHPTGDALLKEVSGRIADCLRKTDTVARLGGDEFAIIAPNIEAVAGITTLAARIVESLAKPFALGEDEVHTGASVGVTIYPHDKGDLDQLMRNADLALYQAKEEGRGTWRLYDDQLNAEVRQKRLIEEFLRRAIEQEKFYLAYQPQIDGRSGEIVGAEALLRCDDSDVGKIATLDLIQVAESTGLIIPISNWVLSEACRQNAAWQRAGLPPMSICVNVSPLEFKQRHFANHVKDVLEQTGLEPQWLQLEITEEVVEAGGTRTLELLQELKAMGVTIALDDFGIGYSSLNKLKKFPIDRLKIDRSFVSEMTTAWEDASVVSAIVRLGHSLNIGVIAEGVETQEQLEFLLTQDCDQFQGYYFTKPVRAEAFVEFVSGHKSRPLRVVEPEPDAGDTVRVQA